MKIIKANSTIQSEVRENHSMSSYLNKLQEGRPATPHSWLAENETSEETLRKWIPIMERANAKSNFGKTFIQFDQKQIEKFGPQGKVPPFASKEAQEVLEPLYSPSDYDSELALQSYFKNTKDFAKVVFGDRLLTKRPLSFKSVVDNMRERDTLSTNSGYPRFKRRSMVRDAEIKDAISGVAYDYPAILLYRQYNGKLRPVWMYPMSMNLIEFSFSQVIQNHMQQHGYPWVQDYLSPWKGFEDVKVTLTQQWKSNLQVDGGDTTKMDAHMRPAQLRLFYECVKWLFQKSYWDRLYSAIMQVNHIDLLVDVDRVITGVHGLASGSGWTQLSETVLQLFMAYLMDVVGQGIGDDFYWLTDMTADELVSYLAKFGLPAKPEKQTVSKEELYFLQRLFHRGFFSRESKNTLGGYYPTIRALNSSLNPEKFHSPKKWNSDMFCIRQYMILENCVDDPCFDELVKFVVKRNRHLIPFAKKTDSELARIQKESRLIPGLNPSYNQEKRDKPLSSFESIQIAKRM